MLNRELIRVLHVDLGTGEHRVEDREDLFRDVLGGAGVAVRLLNELVDAGQDALHPAQPVVLAIGPLTTIFPVVTKTVAAFRSPLTGEYGESHAGGQLASALRYAGYDALVLRGRAACPVYLVVDGDEVEIRGAEPLAGMDTSEAGRVIRDRVDGAGHRSIIRIGPAAERGVRFANVNVDTFRHFGRLGLGGIAQTCIAICLFARGVYDLETVSRALASVGIERSAGELLAMGRRIYWERIRLRERLGFRASAGDVPRRFYETPTPRGRLHPERVANILAVYEQKKERE